MFRERYITEMSIHGQVSNKFLKEYCDYKNVSFEDLVLILTMARHQIKNLYEYFNKEFNINILKDKNGKILKFY